MSEERFKLPPTATKAELIEKYNQLLEAFKERVEATQEAARRRPAAVARDESTVLETARDASVASVLEAVGALRGRMGQALNELAEQLAAEAERLERLRRAAEIERSRLGELRSVGDAADTLAKWTAAWAEKKTLTEAEFAARLQELERSESQRRGEIEATSKGSKEALEADIAKARTAWREEETREKKARAEAQAEREKAWAREEAEFAYQRDRKRKLDADAYAEKSAALDKELELKATRVDASLKPREAAVQTKESDLVALQKEVDQFPKRIAADIERAKREVSDALKKEYEHQAALIAMDRDWEKRMLEQKLAHQSQLVAGLEQKNAEIRSELGVAQKQLQDLAAKALEGASQARAFQSVNQIALEQARRTEGKSKD